MSDFEFDKTKARRSTGTITPVAVKEPVKQPSVKLEEDKDVPAAEKPEYSEDELLQIFDNIIFSNEYSEDFLIRNRLKVTFKTRTAAEFKEIDKNVDSMGSSLISTVEAARSLMNLEFALCSYDGRDLSTLKKEEKTKFVNTLPGPIVGALIGTLAKFDRKVHMACRAGEANF